MIRNGPRRPENAGYPPGGGWGGGVRDGAKDSISVGAYVDRPRSTVRPILPPITLPVRKRRMCMLLTTITLLRDNIRCRRRLCVHLHNIVIISKRPAPCFVGQSPVIVSRIHAPRTFRKSRWYPTTV